MAIALKLIKKIQKKADLIEIWLDHIQDLDLKKLLSSTTTPILLVNKSKKEHGAWFGSEKNRVNLLIEAVNTPSLASELIIDIGIHTKPELINLFREKCPSVKLIISFHNFKKTPSLTRLNAIIRQAKSLGADIIKIATFVHNHGDNLRLLEVLNSQAKFNRPLIIVGMGEYGKLTRIAGCYMGSFLTFAPLNPNYLTAPGQIPFDDLQKIKILV